MATYHGGTGQPLDRDTTLHGQDTDIPNDYHHEDMDNFENAEQENHTNLATLTPDLDDLGHRVQAGEGQPTEGQYTETLYSAQKQTTLVNTLIQDIPTCNGSDSTQLEDWLVDTETAVNLTDESRTKLAQTKSKGLTCTLITEALTSGKCYKEIKDLLCLKICNLDIHTSVSHFMDIRQKEKESLAAYIHRFNGKPRGVTSQIMQQQ